MKKPGLYLFLLCLCVFSIFLLSCGQKSPAPAVTNQAKSGEPSVVTATLIDEKAILKATKAFIEQFTKDLSEGKTEAVLKQLDSSTRLQIGDSLDLTSPRSKKLAEAISKAKYTQVNLYIVFYESTIDGETLSFYILKEAGQWKLGGL
jgi:hypothetical protein